MSRKPAPRQDIRGDRHGRRRRRLRVTVILLVVLLAMPVPWLLPRNDTWGMAWRLNGRLMVNGEVVDPAGNWSWLTAGRPPLVAELFLRGTGRTRDLRDAPPASRPQVSEPMAAAVGLLYAGEDVQFGLVVEAVGALTPDYPDPAILVELNGVALHTYEDWEEAVANHRTPVTFRTSDGELHSASGPGLPYERVYVVKTAPGEVEAAVGGNLAGIPPFSWFRRLALGNSHSLVVALITYAHTVDRDLAQGRHVAATGGVLSDGTVTRIGGLATKAEAAKRAGVDVLIFPAAQQYELADFAPGDMALAPVSTIAEAIAYLEATPID